MIRRYCFGTMFPTETVVHEIAPETDGVPFFIQRDGKFHYRMSPDDIVYGLGENMRGINKRNWHYISDCTDDSVHLENVTSLYAAHNFFIVDGRERFGVFFDYAAKIEFDVGFTSAEWLVVIPSDGDFDLYVIEDESCAGIVRQFRRLIGRSYIPPKWAFGNAQSRWGYKSEQDIRDVLHGYRSNGIPLDSIYLDIDYMRDFADFTVDPERFPDLEALNQELLDQGVHLVPIIDAGIKIKEGDPTYESGKAGGYFCKNADGSDFVAAVWPGLVHFADVLNPKAREWFGEQYRALLDMGIEGFWNDMNEPAIFYTPKRFDRVIEKLAANKGKNLDMHEFLALMDEVEGVKNNPEDYRSMYHMIDGRLVCHEKVHNLYGYNMTRAAGEAFERLHPGKRMLLFSRSSCIGMHRYGGIWFGDNCSWWAHILLAFQMLPSVNMCGFLYAGADIGGFGYDATEDLLLRWMALSIFMPLMRNHSEMDSRAQEPYRFGNVKAFRGLIGLRYSFLPYLYSEYVKAALDGDMLFRPLAFDYSDDPFARNVEDQLLFGEGLMLAPVYTQNAKGRYVYLPEDMKLLVMKSASDYREEILPKGHHYIDVALDEVALFIRKGRLLPLAKPALNVNALDESDLTILGYAEHGSASYTLYQDDGYTMEYENPAHFTVISPK